MDNEATVDSIPRINLAKLIGESTDYEEILERLTEYLRAKFEPEHNTKVNAPVRCNTPFQQYYRMLREKAYERGIKFEDLGSVDQLRFENIARKNITKLVSIAKQRSEAIPEKQSAVVYTEQYSEDDDAESDITEHAYPELDDMEYEVKLLDDIVTSTDYLKSLGEGSCLIAKRVGDEKLPNIWSWLAKSIHVCLKHQLMKEEPSQSSLERIFNSISSVTHLILECKEIAGPLNLVDIREKTLYVIEQMLWNIQGVLHNTKEIEGISHSEGGTDDSSKDSNECNEVAAMNGSKYPWREWLSNSAVLSPEWVSVQQKIPTIGIRIHHKHCAWLVRTERRFRFRGTIVDGEEAAKKSLDAPGAPYKHITWSGYCSIVGTRLDDRRDHPEGILDENGLIKLEDISAMLCKFRKKKRFYLRRNRRHTPYFRFAIGYERPAVNDVGPYVAI